MSKLPINIESNVAEVAAKFSSQITQPWLLVDSASQSLYVIKDGDQACRYIVSTSKYGMGCQQDSFKTPLGAHQIAQRIGGDSELNEIFEGRVATGKIGKVLTEKESSGVDLILTRICWLQGIEKDKNCGNGIDSYQRYIYIHGTHEEGLLGTPASHGCVRMLNSDVVRLYEQVAVGTFVYIK